MLLASGIDESKFPDDSSTHLAELVSFINVLHANDIGIYDNLNSSQNHNKVRKMVL